MYKYNIIKCQIVTNKYFLITTKQLKSLFFILCIHFFKIFSNLFSIHNNFQMFGIFMNLVSITKFQKFKMKKKIVKMYLSYFKICKKEICF